MKNFIFLYLNQCATHLYLLNETEKVRLKFVQKIVSNKGCQFYLYFGSGKKETLYQVTPVLKILGRIKKSAIVPNSDTIADFIFTLQLFYQFNNWHFSIVHLTQRRILPFLPDIHLTSSSRFLFSQFRLQLSVEIQNLQ